MPKTSKKMAFLFDNNVLTGYLRYPKYRVNLENSIVKAIPNFHSLETSFIVSPIQTMEFLGFGKIDRPPVAFSKLNGLDPHSIVKRVSAISATHYEKHHGINKSGLLQKATDAWKRADSHARPIIQELFINKINNDKLAERILENLKVDAVFAAEYEQLTSQKKVREIHALLSIQLFELRERFHNLSIIRPLLRQNLEILKEGKRDNPNTKIPDELLPILEAGRGLKLKGDLLDLEILSLATLGYRLPKKSIKVTTITADPPDVVKNRLSATKFTIHTLKGHLKRIRRKNLKEIRKSKNRCKYTCRIRNGKVLLVSAGRNPELVELVDPVSLYNEAKGREK